MSAAYVASRMRVLHGDMSVWLRTRGMPPPQAWDELLRLAMLVERMESVLDGIVGSAREEEGQTLEALIRRCNVE